MSKKVLIISSSLRGGSNSECLARECERGAKDAGHDVQFISLKGKELKFCIGCLSCQETGKCVLKDDAADIMAAVYNAEVNDDVLFGENWNNQDIDVKTRSIITVVALMAQGITDSSLKFHLQNARRTASRRKRSPRSSPTRRFTPDGRKAGLSSTSRKRYGSRATWSTSRPASSTGTVPRPTAGSAISQLKSPASRASTNGSSPSATMSTASLPSTDGK